MHVQVIETIGVRNNEVAPNLCDPDVELWFSLYISRETGKLHYFTMDGEQWIYGLFRPEIMPKIIVKFSNEEQPLIKEAIKQHVNEICQVASVAAENHVVRI